MPGAGKGKTDAGKKVKLPQRKGNRKNKKLSYEWRRIEYFFGLFELERGSAELWKMLKLALTNDEEDAKAIDRSNMLFFYEHTKELFENIYILLKRKRKR